MATQVKEYGEWDSPLTSDDVVKASNSIVRMYFDRHNSSKFCLCFSISGIGCLQLEKLEVYFVEALLLNQRIYTWLVPISLPKAFSQLILNMVIAIEYEYLKF